MKKQILFFGDCFMKNFHRIVLINSLLLYGFGSIQALEDQTFSIGRIYKKYFEQEKDERSREKDERSREEERYRQEQKELYKKHFERQEEACKKCLKQAKKEAYKPYFKQQEEIYNRLSQSSIRGVCPLEIDEALAEELFANCPQEVKGLVSNIGNGFCPRDQTNILLYGMRQTGKTSLAQAIAIKTQTPCLFFNAGEISDTENLKKIFEFAKNEEKNLCKPCIVIFDGLEALTRIDAAKNDHENNALIKFWERLNNFRNSGVVFIGIIDGTNDLPDEITKKNSMIEVPLPNQKHRETILSCYFNAKKDSDGITFDESITPAIIAQKTNGYSYRELKDLVDKITSSMITAQNLSDGSNKTLTNKKYCTLIKQIEKNSKPKLLSTFKTFFRSPKNPLGVGAIFLGLVGLVNQSRISEKGFALQKTSIDLTERGLNLTAENAKRQMELTQKGLDQNREQFEYTTSWKHMGAQAAWNLVSRAGGDLLGGMGRLIGGK
ncbi:MAG TPA: ATP-binding protein [Candidatus Saccharimonadales bacterium]|nr:ATP-binding protein [Candidatus Saccharimonadales bacterium]